jgi:hypothetical protein
MLNVTFPITNGWPLLPARPGGPFPLAVDKAADPAAISSDRVEWPGAARPPDAIPRPMSAILVPAGNPRPDPSVPTGPPPAFAANILDLLPDSLSRDPDEAVRLEAGVRALPQPGANPVGQQGHGADLSWTVASVAGQGRSITVELNVVI